VSHNCWSVTTEKPCCLSASHSLLAGIEDRALYISHTHTFMFRKSVTSEISSALAASGAIVAASVLGHSEPRVSSWTDWLRNRSDAARAGECQIPDVKRFLLTAVPHRTGYDRSVLNVLISRGRFSDRRCKKTVGGGLARPDRRSARECRLCDGECFHAGRRTVARLELSHWRYCVENGHVL
jgi:hypothetical protein